jgi:hypothetical protein
VSDEDKIQVIEGRLGPLKDLLSRLDEMLVNPTAKRYLLRPAYRALSDVENLLLPRSFTAPNPAYTAMWLGMAEFELTKAEERLKYAQDMIAKYGANLQAITGS